MIVMINRKKAVDMTLCAILESAFFMTAPAAAVNRKLDHTTASDLTYDTYITEFWDTSCPKTLVAIGKVLFDPAASSNEFFTDIGVKTGEKAAVFRFPVAEA